MALAASLALGAGACSLAFARDAYVGNTDSVKKKFQRKLASASRILVRQTLVINGAKQTGYRTLKVVR
jgi:hypothetical protein